MLEFFLQKFASEDITQTLLTYLSRFRELSEDNIKRVVSLIHRQAVKAKAEGLYFKVSTLDLLKSILAEQAIFPKTQIYKELIQLVNYIVRQFFKAVEKEPFLLVEAFFPKNRGLWKPFSSWEPEKSSRGRKDVEDVFSKDHPEVKVKKGYSWSQQVGIAIACLIESNKKHMVDWMKEILTTVIGIRQRIVEETDHNGTDEDEDHDDSSSGRKAGSLQKPSPDAVAKFEDYLIPYVNDEQVEAATKNPQFKLLCRLVKFFVLDDNADELEWYVPAAILPSDLNESLSVINQFLESPIDLNGKKASQMLNKKAKRRRRRPPSEEPQELSDEEELESRTRKARKKKEGVQYKSAQFIEDSDAELGDDDTFFKNEAALRERTSLAAAQGLSATMKPTGTKKRKKKIDKDGRGFKKRKGSAGLERRSEEPETMHELDEHSKSSGSDRSDGGESFNEDSEVPIPRPKPKPKPKAKTSVTSDLPPNENAESREMNSPSIPSETRGARKEPLFMDDGSDSSPDDPVPVKPLHRRRTVVMISDEED